MIPVIIEAAALIEEGYLLFRRLMAAKSIVSDVMDIVNLNNDRLEDTLRYHLRVEGELGYLFLLGDQFILNHLQALTLSEDERHEVVMLALVDFVTVNPSPDVKASLVTFAHCLGTVLQKEYPDTEDALKQSQVNQRLGGVIAEPVFTTIQTNDGTLSPTVMGYLTMLGVESDSWAFLINQVKSQGFETYLGSIEDYFASTPLHTSLTLLNLVLTGATNASYDEPQDIPITTGPQGISLAGLVAPIASTLFTKPLIIVDQKNITNEMIAITSAGIMANKGYVKIDPKGNPYSIAWAKLSETRLTKVRDEEGNVRQNADGSPVLTYELNASGSDHNYGAESYMGAASDKVKERITSTIKGKAIGAVTAPIQAKGKEVIEKFFERYAKKKAGMN